jgi:archaellum biogenesis protein FlaJ (TadC family)
MLQRMIDDFREQTGAALRLTSLAAAAAVALFITTSFLCAAAFVVVLEGYGLVQACLAGAAVFFIVTLIAAGSYIVRKNQIEHEIKARAREMTRAALHTTLADPIVVAAGLQVIRTVGLKRLIPILAVAGLALGFLASRQNTAGEAPAE